MEMLKYAEKVLDSQLLVTVKDKQTRWAATNMKPKIHISMSSKVGYSGTKGGDFAKTLLFCPLFSSGDHTCSVKGGFNTLVGMPMTTGCQTIHADGKVCGKKRA